MIVTLRYVGYRRVVFAQRERRGDIGHLQVLDDHVVDLVAAVASGLDSEPVVGAQKLDVVRADVPDAVYGLAANGQAMTAPEDRVGTRNISGPESR